ncbi:rhomboid family intramembrane serine protease [Eubacterium oxidoreducens]|uniref:Membrane associated serine protease, rhomboid family n=1 Tax=Eubacterium oxidoreducens TaxID=1732 RepID=A0A1G6B5S7_EUBOX|nr:hypothetical protein [Eubacterium oxidoreducens]SDB15919.1 Membrane associated serine protease, rhomboid family [Eubacterium oxidoreducens]
MNFLNKLERTFLGKLAIPNLMRVIIGAYVVGYIIQIMNPTLVTYLTLEPYYIIHGQIWRLISWILIPPSRGIIWAIIMMIFYYQLGGALERTWGTFRFNVYIWGGFIFTIAGAFLLYVIYGLTTGYSVSMGSYFSTYYINMSIFLAFAVSYPNMEVMLYFILPIKMKWLSIFYVALVVYNMFTTNWAGRMAIFMSLLNFLVFFLLTRNYKRVSPKEIHRKQMYKRQTRTNPRATITKHRCVVCGRTEKDDPSLEFRFCSKCNGNFEYCQDHLFTHQHIK